MMNKIKKHLEEASNALFNETQYQIITHIEEGPHPHYSCQKEKKKIYLKANSAASAYFALHNLAIAIKSGHLAEELGEHKPHFAHRILALAKGKEVPLNPELSLFLPNLTKIGWELLCLRMLELGFNTLLFPINTRAKNEEGQNLKTIFKTLKSYGINIIVQPKIKQTLLGETQKEQLLKAFNTLVESYPEINGFFWESQAVALETNQPTLFRDLTQQELVEKEITFLEQAIGPKRNLLFYIPALNEEQAKRQAKWMSKTSDMMNQNTTLIFSPVAGHHLSDHLPPHPFWKKLRESPDASATALMTLINLGGIHLGEGLWPNIPAELIDDTFNRYTRHNFSGAIIQATTIPKQGALLDSVLWSASQYLWNKTPSQISLESWFSARRPELNFSEHRPLLLRVRNIIGQLSQIKITPPKNNTEGKLIAEQMLVELNHLEYAFEHSIYHTSTLQISWKDYFKPFAKDARNIIYHYMQEYQISLPSFRKEESPDTGFWTRNGSYGEILLEEPLSQFETNTPMRSIFLENHLDN